MNFLISYVAPLDGFYLVSASVKVQDGSLKDSKNILNIALNGDPSSYSFQNGLQDYMHHHITPSSK